MIQVELLLRSKELQKKKVLVGNKYKYKWRETDILVPINYNASSVIFKNNHIYIDDTCIVKSDIASISLNGKIISINAFGDCLIDE